MTYLVAAKTETGRKGRQKRIKETLASIPIFSGTNQLLCALENADIATTREGMGWYDGAHSICADIATETGRETLQVAGVLAAFSPQTGWSENIRLTRQACEADGPSQVIGHTSNACGKVSNLLFGNKTPDEVLGGRKVRSFYRNVAYPDVSGAVTVDRHMIDLLVGRRGAVNDRILERIGAYQHAAGIIRGAAREAGILPHQLQAITWVYWRKLHDVKFNYDPKE
jgi:hypothetical protein